jgi:hypothetical protein
LSLHSKIITINTRNNNAEIATRNNLGIPNAQPPVFTKSLVAVASGFAETVEIALFQLFFTIQRRQRLPQTILAQTSAWDWIVVIGFWPLFTALNAFASHALSPS